MQVLKGILGLLQVMFGTLPSLPSLTCQATPLVQSLATAHPTTTHTLSPTPSQTNTHIQPPTPTPPTHPQDLWRDFLHDFALAVVRRSVVVAGNSIGGFMAASLAADYPGLAQGACMCSVVCEAHRGDVQRQGVSGPAWRGVVWCACWGPVGDVISGVQCACTEGAWALAG